MSFLEYKRKQEAAEKQAKRATELTPLFDHKFHVIISNDIGLRRGYSALAVAKVISKTTNESLAVVSIPLGRTGYGSKFRACQDATQAYYCNSSSISSSNKHKEFLAYMTDKEMEVALKQYLANITTRKMEQRHAH